MSNAHRLVFDVSYLVHDFEKYDFPEESNLAARKNNAALPAAVAGGSNSPSMAAMETVVAATKNGDPEGSVLPDLD